MTGKLIRKNNNYICSECRMRQHGDLMPFCYFCGTNFSNYEEILVIKFHQEMDEVLKESYNEIDG